MSRSRRAGWRRASPAIAAGLLVTSASAAAPGAPAARAEQDYMLQCMGCHLADGSGAPGRVPALGAELARFAALPEGREFLVRVPGAAQSPLSDARLAAVLNWMLRRFAGDALAKDFPPFTAAEVRRHRARPLVDVSAARQRLLERVGARR